MKHSHSVQKPPAMYNFFSIWSSSPFYLFLDIGLLETCFDKLALMKFRINTKIYLFSTVISSCLEDYKTALHAFL